MSNRHRSSKAPAGATPSKEQRKATNRKARHRTHELLAHADVEVGEEIVAPRPVHTGSVVERAEATGTEPRRRREYRHWKQKFWKRRNNERARKAQLETSDEIPLPEVS